MLRCRPFNPNILGKIRSDLLKTDIKFYWYAPCIQIQDIAQSVRL
jgi:hypothetical protein